MAKNEKIPRSVVVCKSQIETILKRLDRQIERLKPRIAALEEKKSRLSVHGFQDLGYYRGRVSAMEDMVDDLRELLKASEERWSSRNGND